MGSNWAGAIRKKKLRRTRNELKRLEAKAAASSKEPVKTSKKS